VAVDQAAVSQRVRQRRRAGGAGDVELWLLRSANDRGFRRQAVPLVLSATGGLAGVFLQRLTAAGRAAAVFGLSAQTRVATYRDGVPEACQEQGLAPSGAGQTARQHVATGAFTC